jgi:hypothetical protein
MRPGTSGQSKVTKPRFFQTVGVPAFLMFSFLSPASAQAPTMLAQAATVSGGAASPTDASPTDASPTDAAPTKLDYMVLASLGDSSNLLAINTYYARKPMLARTVTTP